MAELATLSFLLFIEHNPHFVEFEPCEAIAELNFDSRFKEIVSSLNDYSKVMLLLIFKM